MGTFTLRYTMTPLVRMMHWFLHSSFAIIVLLGDQDMAQAFLGFPCTSKRYPPTDMWYHVPRALAKLRGWEIASEDGGN